MTRAAARLTLRACLPQLLVQRLGLAGEAVHALHGVVQLALQAIALLGALVRLWGGGE